MVSISPPYKSYSSAEFAAPHTSPVLPQVRVYNLAKQELAKKLLGSSGPITCLAVHSSGDHVLVGGEDKRLAWYDMDLSTKPYKALRWVAGWGVGSSGWVNLAGSGFNFQIAAQCE